MAQPTNTNPITLIVQQNQPLLKAYQTAEVAGVITTVNYSRHKGEPTTFRIHCPNIGKTFDAVCDLFCPIRTGDTIYALCMIGPDGRLHVSRPPFVQPALDRDSMIQCFMRSLKQGYGPSVKIYSTIARIAGGDDNVIPFLTGIAQSWNDTRNADILFMFDGIEPDDVKKLLNWWHRERNLRRLYLFGLTKKEINACRMTCDEIYQQCMVDPYVIPAIPIEKCDGIMDRLNKRPANENKIRGSIIRYIWKNLHESGWTGTPTRFLSRMFPNIRDHVEALKRDYGMIAEMETAYLKFPHKVETFIAEFFINKRLSDPIEYDTPIDERITLPNGKIIQRQSAHFTRELSEDQQRAIQGALDHNISIITGAAGTGKCLALGTQVLMYDGTIKKIENIKASELVMGPDSKPRTVLSKCVGTDNMFEVIPAKGRSYTFNTPHVLTLKGLEPYLSVGTDKCYIAHYSEKGIGRTKVFLTRNDAQGFIDSLSEDIFDIPLNEYMMRSKDQQQYCHLYHTGVEFPQKDVPIDAYLVGYWLGSGSLSTINDDSKLIAKCNKLLDLCNIQGKDDHTFENALRDLDILDNMHIPNIYKINSQNIRKNLLAGLIDSGGHWTKDNYIEISEKNKKLADDIEYLAFSLGFMVTRDEYEIYQQINIFGDGLENIPVVLNRKNGYITKRATCFRFDVNPVGKGVYCGFELDGDGRFLLGDFLVTHNTSCLGQIIHNLELRGIPYAVCSFTGKAVARIRDVTKKRNPSTMHRLISNTRKNKLDKRSTQFEKDIPLTDYEHIIIDEASMVTTELLYDFLQAYPNISKLTLIGDANQLPPIGWGSMFAQALRSETIPTYKLLTNFRVYTVDGERDGIILNANAIVTHDPTYPFEFIQTNNFSIIEGPIERVYDIIRGCFGSGIKVDQLVVITPYNRSLDVINREFQNIYNVGARFVIDSRGLKWMIGDRVMLTENDSEIGVYNGETGTILDITDKAILVDFGHSGCHEFLLEPTHEGRININQGTAIPYNIRGRWADDIVDGDEGEIDDERTVKRLIHSYALTIDKSQGSEWDFIIVYIPEFNTGSFLNKNRIYTSLTRAKRCCWTIVSDTDAFNIAAVKPPPYRCENLARRLATRLPNIKPFTIRRENNPLEMLNDLPIIPEENIPQDAYDTGFDCDDYD